MNAMQVSCGLEALRSHELGVDTLADYMHIDHNGNVVLDKQTMIREQLNPAEVEALENG